MALRNQLYTFFGISKAKPTPTQFRQLIDTFWSKDEDVIKVSDVQDLSNQLNGKLSADGLATSLVDYFKKTETYSQAQVNALSGSYKGVATAATNPGTPAGAWYVVDTAATLPNFKDASNASIVISSADVTNNFVMLSVIGAVTSVTKVPFIGLVNDLVTGGSGRALTAAQGVVLKALVDTNTTKTAIIQDSSQYASSYLFPILDSNDRILGGWKTDGSFTISKWLAKTIPAAALKDAEVTLAKLAPEILTNFAAASVGVTATANKTFLDASFPSFNGNTEITAWVLPIVDANNVLLGGFDKAGNWSASKYLAKSISGLALKDASIPLTAFDPSLNSKLGVDIAKDSGYVWAITDANERLLVGLKTDGSWYAAKYANNSIPAYALPTSTVSWLLGLKLVTIGDSLTFMCKWQPTVVNLTGVVWSQTETTTGTGGYRATGVGGSKITPIITPSNPAGTSIYSRADDVHYYNPGVIILFGGQNDDGVSGNPDYTEPAYHGPEIGGVNQDGSGTPGTGIYLPAGSPSFVAFYKGTVEKLLTNNPTAKVYLMTRMVNGAVSEAGNNEYSRWQQREAVNKVIRTVGAMYGLTVIDIGDQAGINLFNVNTFFQDTVHLNDVGGVRVGKYISNQLKAK